MNRKENAHIYIKQKTKQNKIHDKNTVCSKALYDAIISNDVN